MAKVQTSIREFLDTVRWVGARGWTPATGGNFSVRTAPRRLLVTASGVDKTTVSPDDLLTVSLKGTVVGSDRRASAETPLHVQLYRLSADIGCVLHTHTVAATVLSEWAQGDALSIRGLEMQKSLQGQTTHEDCVQIALFDNDQDMHALSAQVARRWPLEHGLLVRGHGLYAWGRTVAEARRHLEGLEFLLQCQLERVRLGIHEEPGSSYRREVGGSVKVVLTDIEGTTSSIAFVHEVLFPYAREVLPEWVRRNARKRRVQAVLKEVRAELGEPKAKVDRCIEALVGWIDADAKVTPLKTLQGYIWADGYEQGAFQGHIYDDAVEGLRRWHEEGLALYVYSSGSVGAQKLLFGHSRAGDLTPLFSGYYDTHIGHKREDASYTAIAADIGTPPAAILFLSDVVEELDAARAAGMRTVHLVRDGQEPSFHPVARSFDTIHPQEMP